MTGAALVVFLDTCTARHVMEFLFRQEAEELASSLGLVLYTTSSKEDVNVDAVFLHLAQGFSKKREKVAEQVVPR